MLPPLGPFFLSLTAVAVVGYVITSHRASQRLPPGPKPLPLIGNLLDFPRKHSHITFASWAREYGDLVSLRLFGTHTIINHSHAIAKELLEKRASVFSSRPKSTFAELSGWSQLLIPLMPYGPQWHDRRRLMDPTMRPTAIVQYQPVQSGLAVSAVSGILAKPAKWERHLKQYTASIAASVVYGYNIKDMNDDYVRLAEESNDGQRNLVPGGLLVNDIPLLQYLPSWIPASGFHVIQSIKRVTEDLINMPMAFVKAGMKAGTARPSLVSQTLMQAQSEAGYDDRTERVIAETFGTIYTASVDTTATSLADFLLALCLYPSVQRTAHDEIDKVVGRDRLPTYSDRPSLPYVDAICHEMTRWRPVAPTGLPRVASEDSIYSGYFIPQGTSILNNVWAILHDPKAYPNPESFDPSRYISSSNQFVADAVVNCVFGFGKRKCPGRHFADATIWIFVATFLATCDISDARDEHGEKVTEDVEFVDEITSHPPPFSFTVVQRHEKAKELLHTGHALEAK